MRCDLISMNTCTAVNWTQCVIFKKQKMIRLSLERWMIQWLRTLYVLPRDSGLLLQDPYGGLQPSVTPGPGYLMPSSGFREHQACMWYTDIHISKTYTHSEILSQKIKKYQKLCKKLF